MLLKRRVFNQRLQNFRKITSNISPRSNSDLISNIIKKDLGIKELDTTLVKAGLIFIEDQVRYKLIRKILFSLVAALSFILFLTLGYSILISLLSVFVSCYVALLINVIWLMFRRIQVEREVYYETPLFLEELVLLISSGLALFPALQELSHTTSNRPELGIVRRYVKQVYNLASSGLPISEAFEIVAKTSPFLPIQNVLLHLEVSSSIGGELIFALQSLASQVHTEWKLAVETRVKKLENLVVFPVFAAVIGMILLTAAVPLVPILDFMESLKQSQANDKLRQDDVITQKTFKYKQLESFK